MSKLTDTFKKTVVRVRSRVESEAVQAAMFAMGFCPANHEAGSVRKFMSNPYAENPNYPNGGTIFVDQNCRMSYGSKVHYSHMSYRSTEVEASVVFAAAKVHKKEKRVERKASRKRSKLRKAGWTINTGVEPKEIPEIVLFNNGDTSSLLAQWDYSLDGSNNAYEIAAYKLAAKQVDEIVSQEEMVADIVKSAGGVEVDPDVVTLEEMLIELQPTFTNVWDSSNTVERAESVPDTNPKKQYGNKSIPVHLWSPLATAYGSLGLYNGLLKYGAGNYKATKVEASIYIAAAMRHLLAWAEGQEFDPMDGVPNLGGVLANVAILLDARGASMLIDDRQIMGGYLKEIEALRGIVANLQVLHADKNPRHYSIADNK